MIKLPIYMNFFCSGLILRKYFRSSKETLRFLETKSLCLEFELERVYTSLHLSFKVHFSIISAEAGIVLSVQTPGFRLRDPGFEPQQEKRRFSKKSSKYLGLTQPPV